MKSAIVYQNTYHLFPTLSKNFDKSTMVKQTSDNLCSVF